MFSSAPGCSCTDPVELYINSYQCYNTILGTLLGLLNTVQDYFEMVISTNILDVKLVYRIITNSLYKLSNIKQS